MKLWLVQCRAEWEEVNDIVAICTSRSRADEIINSDKTDQEKIVDRPGMRIYKVVELESDNLA